MRFPAKLKKDKTRYKGVKRPNKELKDAEYYFIVKSGTKIVCDNMLSGKPKRNEKVRVYDGHVIVRKSK